MPKARRRPRQRGRAIRCPYHSWTYGLDGALHIAPYFGGREPRATPPGFDRGEHGLVPVRSAAWHDWIFVNVSGAAPPFEDFVAPLENRLEGVDLTRIHHLVTIDFGEVATNWKLILENFIEPYHVQLCIPSTTEQPLADHYTVNDSGCLGCAVDVSGGAMRHDTLSADSRYLTAFPNFVFGLYLPDEVGVQLNVPLAPAAPSSAAPSTASVRNRGGNRPCARRRSRTSGGGCTPRTTPCSCGSSRAAPPRSPPARGAVPGVGRLGAQLPGARGKEPALSSEPCPGGGRPRAGGRSASPSTGAPSGAGGTANDTSRRFARRCEAGGSPCRKGRVRDAGQTSAPLPNDLPDYA